MTVELRIKIQKDITDKTILVASLENEDEIIAGHSENPYMALRDLINEMEYQEYFRPD